MYVDYTKYFATPDELVEFLCLSVEDQDKWLSQLMENEESMTNREMVCDMWKKKRLTMENVEDSTRNHTNRHIFELSIGRLLLCLKWVVLGGVYLLAMMNTVFISKVTLLVLQVCSLVVSGFAGYALILTGRVFYIPAIALILLFAFKLASSFSK